MVRSQLKQVWNAAYIEKCAVVFVIAFFSISAVLWTLRMRGQALKRTRYRRAELVIDVVRPDLRRKASLSLGSEDTQELLRFFDGIDQGRQSNHAGGWKDAVRITLTDPTGEQKSIGINDQMNCWTEGQGDWDLSPEFEKYLIHKLNEAGENK